MRFKYVYNELGKNTQINCLDSDAATRSSIIGKDSVCYPIPKNMKHVIKEDINKLLDMDDEARFVDIDDQIAALFEERRQHLASCRAKIYPEIMKICDNFKRAHPEEFI